MEEERLLAGLDPAQRRAVTNPHRPLAIVAPAGSGKTRVLTRRVAWLDATGVIEARRSLCVSFTREAAGELRARLAAVGLRELPAAGTFHGIAYALLRAWWAARRLPVPELVADRPGRLAQLFPQLGPSERFRLDAELSWAKARLLEPDGYARAARRAGRRPPGGPARTAAMLARYEDAGRRSNVVDFDDLLVHCIHAFTADSGFAAAQRWRFQHLFVDEFQDVNPLQFRLLQAWLGDGDGDDVCVVGDVNQAIYSWNGADAGYLERFCDHFPGAVVERLDRNYRSTQPIVAVAAAVLPTAPGPTAAAERPTTAAAGGSVTGDGPVPEIAVFDDETHEAAGLAGWCRARYQEGIGWNGQAVLVRTNALARALAERVAACGVPTRLLLARPRAAHAARLARAASQAASLATLAADAASGTLDELDADDQVLLAELVREYAAVDPTGTPARFATWLTGPAASARPRTGVTVATFHAAKGLEWRAVMLAGLEEGVVPSAWATSEAAIAEERRLVHVALSRATRRLGCSWARRRSSGWASGEDRRPSPLLELIDGACHDEGQRRRAVPPPPGLRDAVAECGVGAPPPAGSFATAAEAGVAARLDRVLAWRRQQARAVGAPATAVLSDRATASIAEESPTSIAQLAALPGVGPLRAARVGPSLLAALAVSPDGDAGRHGR